MAERYSFSVDRHLVPNLSVDGSVVWAQSGIDTTNSSLSDNMNEMYLSAQEDNTEYLSVLDSTGEITSDNLNIRLANPKLEEEDQEEAFTTGENVVEQTSEDGNEQQVVVYTMEGSDELFGIQIAQDEDGNIQKYQFQFRRNDDGQLEAIPETIQILPMDDEEVPEEVTTEVLVQQEENSLDSSLAAQIFVQEDNSDEHILPDNCNEIEEEHEESTVVYENDDIPEEEQNEEDTVDVKPGLLHYHNVKQEIQEQLEEYAAEEPDEVETEAEQEHFAETVKQQHFTDDDSQQTVEYLEHQIAEAHANSCEQVEVNPDMDLEQHYDEEEEELEENLQQQQQVEETQVNESDTEDYHIVEGLHITGDVDDDGFEPFDDVQRASPIINNTNILRHALKGTREIRNKKDNRVYLYVLQHPEKENVESVSLDPNSCESFIKTNPRSILKSSHGMLQGKNQQHNETHVEEKVSNRRFARGKEAMQARLFHNFISKTTIPQAPVRKDRLPRKQEIKPVQRMDEEIVVQEVMVSSNGFEPFSGSFNKENDVHVMEYVDLTDSDDDYAPKRKNKRKKHRKRVEITISSESEGESVIELIESDDEAVNQNTEKELEVPQSSNTTTDDTPPKRTRGRPPKNKKSPEAEAFESPLKKMRLEPAPESTEKVEIPCPKCDKSFPSQNSLKTHLQHHNLQTSLQNAQPPTDKYKCKVCGNSFKNTAILTRHVCTKQYNCGVCKKKYTDLTSLTIHKRSHVKENLLKSTTIPARVSPRKIKTVSSTNLFKAPKKVSNSLNCKTCGKLCSSLVILNAHNKTHKQFFCASCQETFPSNLALEKHIRESCVKAPLSHRRSMRVKSLCSPSTAESSASKDAIMAEDKKSLVKPIRAHSGVPANAKLSKAFAELKRALNTHKD